MKLKLIVFFLFALMTGALAQIQYDPERLKDWHLRDTKSQVPGTGVEEAYKTTLKGKTSHEVIVAVIDGGVDIHHEDLQGKIWINPREIANNGLDDDKNGYVDDIHGWNFIGNASGNNVHHDTYESVRTLATLKKKYANTDPSKLDKAARTEYDQYLSLLQDIENKRKDAEEQWKELRKNETILLEVLEAIKKELGALPLTKSNLERVDTSKNIYVNIGQKILLSVLEEEPHINSFDQINQSVKQQYGEPRAALEAKFLYQYNTEFDSRTIVGDHYENPEERFTATTMSKDRMPSTALTWPASLPQTGKITPA